MEIIKHGNQQSNKFIGKCPHCGCEFIADRTEVTRMSTPPGAVMHGAKLFHFYICDCPECKLMVSVEPKQDDVPEYAELDNNGFIGCQIIETLPNIPENILNEKMITQHEIMKSYNEIDRRRYEDNLPWWKKIFKK